MYDHDLEIDSQRVQIFKKGLHFTLQNKIIVLIQFQLFILQLDNICFLVALCPSPLFVLQLTVMQKESNFVAEDLFARTSTPKGVSSTHSRKSKKAFVQVLVIKNN